MTPRRLLAAAWLAEMERREDRKLRLNMLAAAAAASSGDGGKALKTLFEDLDKGGQ